MIVDSSVWIDWFRRNDSPHAPVLDRALRSREVRLLPVVLQEVLQGAASQERFMAWQRALNLLPVETTSNPAATAVHAAALYARCRWAGYTICSPNDCLIAASCIELQESLLHQDAGFERIAQIAPELSLVGARLPPASGTS